MALPAETPFEDVLVKLKKAREGSGIRQVANVVLKKGPRAYKTAALLEVINTQTGEIHHHTLVLEQVKFTKKNGWEYESKHKITLEDKDAVEIHDLFVFLNAHYSGELKDKIGNIHVLSDEAFAKHERIIQLIPSLEDEDKLGLIGQLLANVKGIKRTEFNKLFEATGGATLHHIAASSRMVEYKKAYDEMVVLVDDPSSSEHAFQRHLDQNPWMFGSEYSELLSRRNWTRDDELDYMLRRTVDGYLEIVEIKTAFSEPLFLHDKSHDSYYPSSKLSKAVGQVMRYIEEVERNRDTIIAKDNVDTLKIKARIIVGRNGTREQQAALRNFNSHLHGIEVFTFDQLMKIAERVLSMFQEGESQESEVDEFVDDGIPF